jgi:GMP synthase (glutamine-hydrolysing)
VVHTLNGSKILKNFTHKISGFKGDWTMASFKGEMIEAIKEQVGSSQVICGLSGGVDSSVAAVLIHEAIGEQLTCVYVDTGMMRKGETEQVVSLFKEHYDMNLIAVDASEKFLKLLMGVSDPEKKRKIIGGTFIDIFEREAKKNRRC